MSKQIRVEDREGHQLILTVDDSGDVWVNIDDAFSGGVRFCGPGGAAGYASEVTKALRGVAVAMEKCILQGTAQGDIR